MKVSLNGDKLDITFGYSPYTVSFVKLLDGRKWDSIRKVWTIPLAGSSLSVQKLKLQGFTIAPEVEEAVAREEAQQAKLDTLHASVDTEFTTTLPLLPYQKVGAKFLCDIGSGLLGDDVGLGKSIQSLAVADSTKAKKVLILCPSSLKYQWESEIEKFIPGSTVSVVDGSPKERVAQWKKPARFYVANYEILLRDEEPYACTWDLIIADEATKIANPYAKQSKATKLLKARNKIALTGTPISNRAHELWSIIDFCVPDALGNYQAFLNKYCVRNQWNGIVGYQNMDELKKRIRRYMIRRLKKDVLKELPDRVVSDVPFKLSDRERALYDKLKQELLFEIEKEDINKIEAPTTIQMTLVKMLRLRQLANSMELLGESTESSKLELLKTLLPDHIEAGRKIIIFTQFSEMADILAREFKCFKITGEIDTKTRNAIVKAFNEQAHNQILIMTEAGAYGLNLQSASVIIHYDLPWSIAKMTQREGRAHRMGQKETVFVYSLLARGTVDMYVKKILFEKQKLSEDILGDTPISMDDIKKMLTYEE